MDREKAIRIWNETEAALDARMTDYNAHPETKWIDPFRVVGNVYYVGDRVVAAHLVDSGDGLILLDSCFPHTIDELFRRITTLGFRLENIRYVVHTHEHVDHFGASRVLQVRYGSRTFIHRDGARTFRIHPHHTELQSAHSPDAALFVPDVEVSDRDTIELGNVRIECIHTPGHSAGATTFLFDTTEGDRTVRVGLCGINGTLTLHAGRLFKYGIPLSTRDDYLASIRKLRSIRVDVTLDTHPRPGGAVDKRELMIDNPAINPFVDPDAWSQTLDYYQSRFEDFARDEAALLGS